MPMRVLHLCWSYPSPQFPEDGSFLRNIAEFSSSAELHAMVATPVPYVPKLLGRLFPRTRRFAQLPRRYEFGGVQVFVPRYPRMPHALIGERLPAMLARVVESAINHKPDILHAHYAYPYGLAALHLRSKWGVPVVVTLHGSDATVLPYQSEADRRRFIEVVRGADQVLAVSEDIVNRTRDLTGRTIQFWPIGVDLDRFRRRDGEKGSYASYSVCPQTKNYFCTWANCVNQRA